MRSRSSAWSRRPAVERPGLRVTIALAAVAYMLLVLTCGMAVERLVAATPPDFMAGITQAAASGWLPP